MINAIEFSYIYGIAEDFTVQIMVSDRVKKAFRKNTADGKMYLTNISADVTLKMQKRINLHNYIVVLL